MLICEATVRFHCRRCLLGRNGFYIEVESLKGYSSIDGSMDRGEFRFAQILDWIRQNVKPLV